MEKVTRKITLSGIRPIMFDRYVSMKEVLVAQDKVYRSEVNPQELVIPSMNLMSFLSSQNTESATQRVIGRGWKAVAKAALTFIEIDPMEIPIMRDGRPARVDDIIIDYRKAIVKKGNLAIPQDKERPVLPLPWEISFTLTLYRNPDLSEATLRKIFGEGGIQVGLGSYRGVFGKFIVKTWE